MAGHLNSSPERGVYARERPCKVRLTTRQAADRRSEGPPISDLRSPTSDFRPPTSDLARYARYARIQFAWAFLIDYFFVRYCNQRAIYGQNGRANTGREDVQTPPRGGQRARGG